MHNLNNNLPILAIVVPCYNEELAIEPTSKELLKILNKLKETRLISQDSYISFIDDGSTDLTFKNLTDLSEKEKSIRTIKLLSNSGHQNAIYCGMVENDADIYITIDCDLQDDTNAIYKMVNIYRENAVDVVYGVRKSRNTDTFLKRFLAESYYKLNSFILANSKKNGCLYNHADFRLVSKNVVTYLKQIKEHNLYLRGIIYNQNFKHDIVYYDRKSRNEGYSKYSFISMLELALSGIINQTLLPLRCIFVLAFLSFIMWLFNKSSLYFIGFMNLFAIALLGEYLGRIFTEVRNRPKYIISDKINY